MDRALSIQRCQKKKKKNIKKKSIMISDYNKNFKICHVIIPFPF
ncbi:unnamed protein product [Arabidopsis halleri]